MIHSVADIHLVPSLRQKSWPGFQDVTQQRSYAPSSVGANDYFSPCPILAEPCDRSIAAFRCALDQYEF